jgi:hypothetical protein
MQFLIAYVDTRSLSEAFRLTFNLSYAGSNIVVSSQVGVINQVFSLVTFFLLIVITRFMRLKLVASEPELSSLAPGGEETVHRAFKLVPKIAPQAILGILFLVASVPNLDPSYSLAGAFAVGPVYGVWTFIQSFLVALILGSFIWIYASSLWGLHELGKEPLKLKHFSEDSMLGVRPIGSIALTLFLSYFVITGLGTLVLLFAPDPLGLVLVTGLTIVGVILFFLPLNNIHLRMQNEKHLHQAAIRRELVLLSNPNNATGPNPQKDPLSRVSELMILQMRRDDAARIPTWPFDTTILSRFAAVIISLTIVLVSRVIIDVLKI